MFPKFYAMFKCNNFFKFSVFAFKRSQTQGYLVQFCVEEMTEYLKWKTTEITNKVQVIQRCVSLDFKYTFTAISNSIRKFGTIAQ